MAKAHKVVKKSKAAKPAPKKIAVKEGMKQAKALAKAAIPTPPAAKNKPTTGLVPAPAAPRPTTAAPSIKKKPEHVEKSRMPSAASFSNLFAAKTAKAPQPVSEGKSRMIIGTEGNGLRLTHSENKTEERFAAGQVKKAPATGVGAKANSEGKVSLASVTEGLQRMNSVPQDFPSFKTR